MKQSKYLNQKFYGGWYCTAVFLAANYSHCTAHNAYRYQLKRITTDGKCLKSITVSGPTMKKIADGIITADAVVKAKKKSSLPVNEILYKFN